MERRGILAVLVTVMAVLGAREARAEDAPCRVVTRANVGACAVASSAAVHAEREGIAAAHGRRVAAEPWFPSSPTLSLGASQRHDATGRDALNYHAALSQEIEIAGQRSSRRRAAEAEISARTNDTTAVARRVAASAYVAYFDAVAARESIAVARRLETASADVAKVTRARADAGVASNLDAEVAEAAALRLVQARLAAERGERVALAQLATILGRDAARDPIVVDGALDPIANVDAIAATQKQERPEVRALRDEQRAFVSRAEAFRRSRFPTLTLQIFAQNDGFDERVLGGAIGIPLPLPQPLGRTYEGEAAEAEALARQAALRAEQTRREHDGALAAAIAAFQAARAEVALFEGDRIPRTEKLLADVAKEIESGRLAVRDAIVAQRELVEVLRGRVEARRALSLASVDLAYAAGLPLEQAQP